MNKKSLAVLLAGAVAAAGIIGLTACNKDDGGNGNGDGDGTQTGTVQSGVQVTEQEWKDAITATAAAKSYTAYVSMLDTETASGKVGEETVNYKCIESTAGSFYFDLTNKKIYSESDSTANVTGGKLFDEEDGVESEVYNYYIETENLTVWTAYYHDAETGWTADSNTLPSEELLELQLSYRGIAYALSNSEFSTTKGGESKKVSELYSAFTYDGGRYSATLYDEDGDENKLSVSVKDGYIISIVYELTFDYKEGEIDIHDTVKTVYNFEKFGSTTVTAPEGAAAAITAAKTPSAN